MLNAITTSHNDQIVYTVGTLTSPTYMSGAVDDAYISSHLASDGSLLKFKVLGANSNDQLFGISISKMGHLSVAGRSLSTAPRMSYSSTWVSIIFLKGDVSLGDMDCMVTKTPPFTDRKTVFTAMWELITTATMVIHSQIGIVDRTSTFSFVS